MYSYILCKTINLKIKYSKIKLQNSILFMSTYQVDIQNKLNKEM